MTNANVFAIASRKKFRFETPRGLLVTEQLWDLPLTSDRADALTLDGVAKDLARKLRAADEESFVRVSQSAATEELSTKLELVKEIIAFKLAEQEAAKTARERAVHKQRILEALAEKDEAVLKSKSREELLKELEEL